MQSLETKSSRPRPKRKSLETQTDTTPETFETETETPKYGFRHTPQDRDQVSRLHHWLYSLQSMATLWSSPNFPSDSAKELFKPAKEAESLLGWSQ